MTNIRDGEDFAGSWWDWTPYNECFKPTKIRISDLDGIVERNEHVLVIETKRPNAYVTDGQRFLFDTLIKIPNWNVMIVWGERNRPLFRKFWGDYPKVATDEEKLKAIIRKWFKVANDAKRN